MLTAVFFSALGTVRAGDPLDRYNVAWTTPGEASTDSMPIGNGDVGANVWMQSDGKLYLLLSKTDAWSENCRLLKLGRLCIAVEPNPLAGDGTFRQTLRLRQGEIEIVAGPEGRAVTLRVWIDANRPVVRVEADSEHDFQISATLQPWRVEPRELQGNERHSAYGISAGPDPIICRPDTVVQDAGNRIEWYHRNASSIWAGNLRHQGLGELVEKLNDPLMGLTFGARVEGDGLKADDATTLRSATAAKRFVVSIYPLTAQTPSADVWRQQLNGSAIRAGITPLETARSEHHAWWNEFWNRSWIRSLPAETTHPGTNGPGFVVTRGYTLQRWISACAGRGGSPIKFNGTIFTVDMQYDADYRAWGGPYWWQNTRLPYWPMLACGDFDMMMPLFRMYQATLPLARERSRVWFGHEGATLPETMYFWGMYVNDNYGWKRDGLHVSELTNRYIRREYTCSLELLAMMIDYYDFTRDQAFLTGHLLPMADGLMPFWDVHYKRDAKGHIRLAPAQALETLQNAVNPSTDIAGLHWVLGQLLKLPEAKTGPKRREFWQRLAGEVPPLPMGEADGKRFILGAEKVIGGRGNSENPELYAVFPFRLFGVGKPHLEIGRETFARRHVKGNNGWRQDEAQAAQLGLTGVAAGYLAQRAANKHKGSRFPAFWGPNMDWIPDQDHGGNLMIALQAMLMQTEGGRIVLLPAWPDDWNVEFKLHAPRQTTVSGIVRNGKIENLIVQPKQRAGDVVLGSKFNQ